MNKAKIIFAAAIALADLGPYSVQGQPAPVSGLYEITSGTNWVIGGFSPLVYRLPNASQSFVQLTVDTQSNLAQLAFLAGDGHTVLTTQPAPGSTAVPFLFRGSIFADHLEFGDLVVPPQGPNQPTVSYRATFSTDELRISGKLTLPYVCCDIPDLFMHTNVVARIGPTVAIRSTDAGGVELRWNSGSNRNYQVQYRTSLTTGIWTNLGSPVAATNATSFFTDLSPLGARRFYRVAMLP